MPSKTQLSPAAQSRQRLTEAEAKLHNGRQARDAQQVTVADLRRRRDSGDVTAAVELATAEAGLAHMDVAIKRLERDVERARQALRAEVADLAELIAPAMADVAVSVATAVVEPTEVPDALPALVMLQTKPSEPNTLAGTIGGEVELRFYRTKWHRALDSGQVDRLLNAAGIRGVCVSTGTRTLVDGTLIDTGSIDDVIAFEELPSVIEQHDLGTLTNLPMWIADDAIAAGQRPGELQTMGARGEGAATVVSDSVTGDVRRRVLHLRITGWPAHGRCERDDVARAIRAAVEARTGKAIGGLGRVERAQVVKTGLTEDGLSAANVELVVLSKVA